MFFYTKNDFIVYVTNLIVKVNDKLQKKITQIQIQKIIYIIYSYFLIFKKPICKIDFETWRWGPVIYELWKTQTIFKANNVKIIFDEQIAQDYKNGEIEDLCLKIVDFMLTLETWDIVTICHEQTPWKMLYIPNKNVKIKDIDIIEFHQNNPDNFFEYLDFVLNTKYSDQKN